jgi:DNA-directed RNA polymerase subunit M/transcription elongation factor TFIIS
MKGGTANMNFTFKNILRMALNKRYSYCPKCGSVLELQDGYDENAEVHICKECGEQLLNPSGYCGERFPDVIWYCDECGAVLNNQKGFSDYHLYHECQRCGYINKISLDEIYESEDVYQEHRRRLRS